MDIKNIRQKLKEQKDIEQADDTSGAPGPAIDNLQNVVNRLVKTIDVAGNIKDLTALTTQGELYDAIAPNASVNQLKQYLITLNHKTGLITSTIIRTTTLIEFNFTTIESGLVVQNIIVCNKDSTAAPLVVAPRLRTLAPIHDDEATNKKYVDDKFSETITLVFSDGTTEDIKVGK